MPRTQLWKVGELASEAGLTVRTLHHYDRIGLVRPARRTATGHRLYTDTDVQRLYQVSALRQLGLGLDQIANVLAGAVTVGDVLSAHRDRLAAQMVALEDLHARVATLAATAENRPGICADHFLELIRRTVMVENTAGKHFTRDNATAFAALYFAQLTARQHALELWYAENAQLTVDDTPYQGPTAIVERLTRLSPSDYEVQAIDIQTDTDLSALVRVTGKRVQDRTSGADPFATSFTLSRAGLIVTQTFHGA
ncbi:MerR family transcriptional regulator [Nocardia sp. NPDC048505]|uniref:MerR family transcriptional regulator n=1 Tax=unclassified Nocardia TaxID=2637762 RepID=UPI0034058451